VIDVTQHDGSVLRLRKLAANYDPTNRQTAMTYLQERQAAGEVVTGLLYVNDASGDMNDRLNTVEAPLNSLGEAELCPGSAAIEAINASLR
jgi:2-oxoglutarate ferredoxin oxidoreductase subunit beta